jgi:hypothetical protein
MGTFSWSSDTVTTAALTPPLLRRTLASTMPAGFDATFARVKELVPDCRYRPHIVTAMRFLSA